MRKAITVALLLMISTAAHSARCCVNGSQCKGLSGSDTFTANATVRATDAGKTIRIDGYELSCRFNPYSPGWPGSYADFWRTLAPVLTPSPIFAPYSTGLSIKGTDHLSPISSGILVAKIPNQQDAWVNLETYMFVRKRGTPGGPINIRRGDRLGDIKLRQTNNYDGTSNTIMLALKAGNDLVIQPSTCTINGNRAIEVNFKEVSSDALGSDPYTSTVRNTQRLTYTCPDPGVTTPITITFKGTPSAFDRRVLATSNNLGTGMIRAGALVAPEGRFLTSITNSTGGDDVTFTLVRNPKTPPASGAFTASGTLVMGVP